LILCGQIYGPGLGRHDPTKARYGLGPGWVIVFTLRASTAMLKSFLGFPSPNPFGTKHDGLGPGWLGPTQFLALDAGTGRVSLAPSLSPCMPPRRTQWRLPHLGYLGDEESRFEILDTVALRRTR
jgi:hypothetical protein